MPANPNQNYQPCYYPTDSFYSNSEIDCGRQALVNNELKYTRGDSEIKRRDVKAYRKKVSEKFLSTKSDFETEAESSKHNVQSANQDFIALEMTPAP